MMNVDSGDGPGDGVGWTGGTDLPDDPTFGGFNPLGDGFEALSQWATLDAGANLLRGSITLADARPYDQMGASPINISHHVSDSPSTSVANSIANGTVNGHSSIPITPSVSEAPQRRKAVTDDCEARALTALHSLHWCTMLHTDRPGEPKQTMTPPNTSDERVIDCMPPLDKVLYFNHVAIGTLKELIECPCVHQPHLTFLCMTIASKVLFWYRLAVSSQYQSGHGHCPSSSDHNPTFLRRPSHSSKCSDIADRAVKNVSFQIGVFDLEDEDQKILVKGVLLKEVRKMEAVVEKMKTLGGEYTRDDELHGLNWYEVAGSKMQAEVQDTLKQIEEFGARSTRPGR